MMLPLTRLTVPGTVTLWACRSTVPPSTVRPPVPKAFDAPICRVPPVTIVPPLYVSPPVADSSNVPEPSFVRPMRPAIVLG